MLFSTEIKLGGISWIEFTAHKDVLRCFLSFLPRDALLARYVLSLYVRPSHAGIVPQEAYTEGLRDALW